MKFAIVRTIFLAGLILLYGLVFSIQEQKNPDRDLSLDVALPATFHKITAGYLKQLVAEMLFVKVSVFIGGVQPSTPPSRYAEALGNNFEVMTQLYPRFIAPYYFCQAFLPHLSSEAAANANRVFETGIAAYPDDLILRFFHGTNFFLAMNEPLKGAKAFAEAAKLPNAPPLFAHLAALLSAKGGDISAGLLSLKIMLESEEDETVRARYQEEIYIFEQAMAVNQALNAYTNKYGVSPASLDKLVPEFLPQIPVIKDSFILIYDPPTLHLLRPEKRSHAASPRK